MMAQSAVEMRRWGGPAIVTLAAIGRTGGADRDAAARQERPAPPPRRRRRAMQASRSWRSCRSRPSRSFYDAEGWILRAPVSTGTNGTRDACGIFAVIEKDEDHHSSLYDGCLDAEHAAITWNGIALITAGRCRACGLARLRLEEEPQRGHSGV